MTSTTGTRAQLKAAQRITSPAESVEGPGKAGSLTYADGLVTNGRRARLVTVVTVGVPAETACKGQPALPYGPGSCMLP